MAAPFSSDFWRAKLPRFHTKPSNFCNIQIIVRSEPYRAYFGLKTGVLAISSMLFPVLIANAPIHVRLLGGEAGHRRGFDITSLPVVGTFDHSPGPGSRNFWLQPLVDWALPTPSWISAISAILDDREWLETNCTELEENNVPDRWLCMRCSEVWCWTEHWCRHSVNKAFFTDLSFSFVKG